MCSNDGQRLFEVMANGPYILGGPLVFIAGSVYLGFLLGPWALLGIATYIVFFTLMVRTWCVWEFLTWKSDNPWKHSVLIAFTLGSFIIMHWLYMTIEIIGEGLASIYMVQIFYFYETQYWHWRQRNGVTEIRCLNRGVGCDPIEQKWVKLSWLNRGEWSWVGVEHSWSIQLTE